VKDVLEHFNGPNYDAVSRFRPGLNTSATIPLVLGINQYHRMGSSSRHYYFRFFGYVAKLPYERSMERWWRFAPHPPLAQAT